MSIFRLLPFSLAIAAGVATSAAQTPSAKTPITIQSMDARGPNSSANMNDLSFDLTAGSTSPNLLDRVLTGDYTLQLNQFSVPHPWLSADSGSQVQGDYFCLTMRTYKVARDDRNSDSTHPVSYSTCQPAARFRTHTIEGVIRPTTP
jgi:hypothetical protein